MTVTHQRGSYEIEFVSKSGLASHVPAATPIITDENVGRLYAGLFPDNPKLLLPAGEEFKNLNSFARCLEWLAESGVKRGQQIVALGGGVIGDLVGFAAAAYMRGVRFIQIPTTLLAQVDSSIGGKVGVDLPQGKNLAGSFHAPSKVLICTELLTTLPKSQFANGMAEVWKYGFIMDADLVKQLSEHPLDAHHPELEAVVRRCIEHKRDVVQADEFETTGLRATLNFGHTIGHALEQMSGYTRYLHGEAISIGMVVEAHLGEKLGVSEPGTSRVVKKCLAGQGLPVTSELLNQQDLLIETMARDKKASGKGLAFSLVTKIGECKLVEGISGQDVKLALQNYG